MSGRIDAMVPTLFNQVIRQIGTLLYVPRMLGGYQPAYVRHWLVLLTFMRPRRKSGIKVVLPC
jgi:hypothetical protein